MQNEPANKETAKIPAPADYWQQPADSAGATRRKIEPLDPSHPQPAKAWLLPPAHDNPYFHGYLARVEGLPSEPPSGPLLNAQAWVGGWHAADGTPALGHLNLLSRLLVPDTDAHLGRPGAYLRDRYAYHELANAAFRADPDARQVPVISIAVAGQGTFTAPLSERLRFEGLHLFLHDAGVLGDHDEGAGAIGAITYHLWTPQRLEKLPEWPG